jgi:hypothetical protein
MLDSPTYFGMLSKNGNLGDSKNYMLIHNPRLGGIFNKTLNSSSSVAMKGTHLLAIRISAFFNINEIGC